MKIGFVYPQTELGGDPEAVRRIGLAAEHLGYTHLLAYDHVVGAPHDREPKLLGPYTDRDPFHDPFIMFSYLAGMTQRLEFMTGVLILPQRPTVLVAKQAADLDLLSGQRFRMGVGIGWNYVEYQALGQDFKTRGRKLDEQIVLLRRLWTEPLLSFDGSFDHLDRCGISPRPKRPIPIWSGGMSEPAFHRAARTGDGFIFSSGSAQADADLYFRMVGEWMGRVNHHRKELDRAHLPFGYELQLRYTQSAAEAAHMIKRWQDLGGTHASLHSMGRNFRSIEAHIDYMSETLHYLKSQ
jgi:probable F420-dependent oxidoreductase